MKSLISVSAIISIFFLSAFNADAFRCKEKIIGLDSSRGEIIAACGEPAFSDRWEEERLQTVQGDRGKDILSKYNKGLNKTEETAVALKVSVEEWLYDFGPHLFTQRLIFENGKLTSIRAGDYGHKLTREEKVVCYKSAVSLGATKSELYWKCGEPSHREAGIGERTIEEWSYPGSGNSMVIFKFMNGKLADTRTVDRGD